MNCPSCGAAGPCYCSRNRPARPRNTGYPAPTYRRPPRSHAYNCQCARCAQVAKRPWGAEAVLPVFFGACAVIMGIGWVARHAFRAVLADPAVLIPFALLAAVIAAVVFLNRRENRSPRPPKGRLKVEATPQDGTWRP